MQEVIATKLEEMGGKRWTKGKYDRIYFSDEMLGLRYRTDEHGSYRINASKFMEYCYN